MAALKRELGLARAALRDLLRALTEMTELLGG